MGYEKNELNEIDLDGLTPYIATDYACPMCGKQIEVYYPAGQPYAGACFNCLPETRGWQWKH